MIRQKMNFTQQKLSAAPTASLACVIDFFEARDRLSAEFAETGKCFEMKRKVRKVAARRIPSVERIDRLEESLYWLLSAATLGYLVLAIIGR